MLLPIRSVGVMGDGRTYDLTCAIRAVTSTDAMTADWARLPHDVLGAMSTPHRERGARDQPRRLRHLVEAAVDDRVGVIRAGLILLTIALGLVRHLPLLSDPWDRSNGAINGAWYMAQPVRNWDRLGFAATRGTAAPHGGADETAVRFALHPPPSRISRGSVYSAVSRFGWSEASFRLLPAVFAALSGGLIVLLALGRRESWRSRPPAARFGSRCR